MKRLPWPSYTGDTNPGSEYSDDQIAFLKAVERWKRRNDYRMPDCRDVLAIATELGYRKVAQPET